MKRTIPLLKKLLARAGKNDGFTLLELMIVIAIIAIIGGFAVSRFTTVLDNTKIKAAQNDIQTMKMNLERYYIEQNSYPATEEGLQKLIDTGLIEKKKTALLDPWDNPYQYRYPGQFSDGPEIWSLGADKQEGGEGINRDITSWE